MTLVWIIFTVILFILEPFVLHKLFRRYAEEKPGKTFDILHNAHWFLLIISLITIIGALAGSHGLYFSNKFFSSKVIISNWIGVTKKSGNGEIKRFFSAPGGAHVQIKKDPA